MCIPVLFSIRNHVLLLLDPASINTSKGIFKIIFEAVTAAFVIATSYYKCFIEVEPNSNLNRGNVVVINNWLIVSVEADTVTIQAPFVCVIQP